MFFDLYAGQKVRNALKSVHHPSNHSVLLVFISVGGEQEPSNHRAHIDKQSTHIHNLQTIYFANMHDFWNLGRIPPPSNTHLLFFFFFFKSCPDYLWETFDVFNFVGAFSVQYDWHNPKNVHKSMITCVWQKHHWLAHCLDINPMEHFRDELEWRSRARPSFHKIPKHLGG